MKKFITTLIILLSLASFSLGADFRNVNWGMTPDEVKQNESIELHPASINEFISLSEGNDRNVKKAKQHTSVLEGRVIEDNMFKFIKYTFLDEKLQGISCTIHEYSDQRSAYIKQYMDINRDLTSKYGIPTTERENFFDKKSDTYLIGFSSWELSDGTIVGHRFILDDTERFPIHRIFYSSKSLIKFLDELKAELKKPEITSKDLREDIADSAKSIGSKEPPEKKLPPRQRTPEEETELNGLRNKMGSRTDSVENVKWIRDKAIPEGIGRHTCYVYLGSRGNENNGTLEVWPRFVIGFSDCGVIFFQSLIFNIDGERSEIDVGKEARHEVDLEYVDLPGNEHLELLNKIASSKKTAVRFKGFSRSHDYVIPQKNKDAMKRILRLYELLRMKPVAK